MSKFQIEEANAANREYLDGKLSLSDMLAIIHDLARVDNGNSYIYF